MMNHPDHGMGSHGRSRQMLSAQKMHRRIELTGLNAMTLYEATFEFWTNVGKAPTTEPIPFATLPHSEPRLLEVKATSPYTIEAIWTEPDIIGKDLKIHEYKWKLTRAEDNSTQSGIFDASDVIQYKSPKEMRYLKNVVVRVLRLRRNTHWQ